MNDTPKTSKPFANESAVKRVAELLMLINGETTSTEVKKLLQLEGFVVHQDNVLAIMDKLTQEGKWISTGSGIHKIFTFQINVDFQINPNIPKFSSN